MTMEMLTGHNREILDGIDEIRLRLLDQQGSEIANMRSCEHSCWQVLSILIMLCLQLFTRD
jgi:hypothetical protein